MVVLPAAVGETVSGCDSNRTGSAERGQDRSDADSSRRAAGRRLGDPYRAVRRIGLGLSPAAVCCLLIGVSAVRATTLHSPTDLLNQAVAEYQSALDCSEREQRVARYHRAELLFSRLIEGAGDSHAAGIRNADLYTNQGNAALGAERLGPAILAYRRALELTPNHTRARQNLKHARSLLPDWVPHPQEAHLLSTLFGWIERIPPTKRQLISAGAFLLTAALIASSIRWNQRSLRQLALIPGVFWLICLAMILASRLTHQSVSAVVILPEVVARSADSVGAPARLAEPLPGGTELTVLETRRDWVHVALADARDAWLPSSSIAWVTPPQPPPSD